MESSLDGVILMDGSGIVVDVNQVVVNVFDLPRDAVIGRRLGDVFVPPELRQAHEAGLRRYLRTGRSAILGTRVEVEAMHPSGRRIPVELSIVRLQGIEPPLFMGHLRTLAAARQSERRLRLAAAVGAVLASSRSPEDAVDAVLRCIGENLGCRLVQFWTVADSNRIVMSRRWTDQRPLPEGFDAIRFPRGEGLPGRVWAINAAVWIEDVHTADFVLPRAPAFTKAGVRCAIGFPVRVEGAVTAVIEKFLADPEPPDPELIALLEALGAQLGHVVAMHDARASLERANKAKDQLLAVVSHELRTPLGPIMGWARMLQRAELDTATRQRAADAILRNAELEATLVEDLLDFSRIATRKLHIDREPVSIPTVVSAALEGVVATARAKQITVEFGGDFDVPVVLGDAKRLQQVFSNLLVNAVKFTPEGGEIAISIQPGVDTVEISVRDTGQGIDPKLLPTIFEPFRQASYGGGPGLGLGLAIVRDLVAAHGGTVQAFSSGLGRGAEFVVRLPTGPAATL